MKLELIQSSCNSINSIYVIRDFLDNTEYLQFLTNKIENLTKKDEMNRSTNVQASMTKYDKLSSDADFDVLHKKILETLAFIYKLRTPHPNHAMRFSLVESWGMSHQKGDFTRNHIHNSTFSAAYYLKVPCKTSMYFDDFNQEVFLEPNLLLLFTGLTKHRVGEHTSDENRISMALNINMTEFNEDQ